MNLKNIKKNKGFTLIEILVVIGIIAILAAIVIIAINPARQFAQARNTQRTANVNAILNAVGQRMADNKGIFETDCTAGAIPTTTAKNISSNDTDYNIRDCLVPTYIPSLPYDPTTGVGCAPSEVTCTTYDTGYKIIKDGNGRITVSAPAALVTSELSQTISVTR